MIGIITGDIINSADHKTAVWMAVLRNYFSGLGDAPTDWEIYRGDEFQIRTHPEAALGIAIHVKALVRSLKNLDVRIGIGLGEETFVGSGVSDSNGPAYQRSGHVFETLKERKLTMAIATGNPDFDTTLNLMLKLALHIMDDWSQVSAEVVALALQFPDSPQSEIARQLNIQQSAVSQRQKRARLDLVQELLAYYAQTLKITRL